MNSTWELYGSCIEMGGEALRAVGVPSLEVPKARLDGALGTLNRLGTASPWQGVELDGL